MRARPSRAGTDGSVAVEMIATVPVLAVLLLALLMTLGVVRDVLAVHEAARAGARAAATTSGTAAATAAARTAAGRAVTVEVIPAPRRPGDLVTVRVSTVTRLGPLERTAAATATTLVEPAAGAGARSGPEPGAQRGPEPGAHPGAGG